MDMKTTSRRSSASTAAVAALLLAAALPALAQNPAPPGTTLPAREGNIYDHRDHQPTQAEIDNAAAAAGVRPPPSANPGPVEDEVKALLKQTDEADKRSDEDVKSGASGGR
jgi:hypothetical protein